MNRDQVYEKLEAVFQDVFDDDSIRLSDRTTANDIEDWDSLNHITLISAIEDEFHMSFTMGETSTMKDVGEMVDILCERAQEKPKKKRRFF